MFCRCDIAEECCTIHCGNGTTDGSRDVVITRCDIGNKRSEYIERSTHADGLLNFHVCSNLIERNVSRTFNHNLNIVSPCTFGEFTQTDKLFDLADICGISQTSWTAGITERDSNVMFFADIKDFIEIFIERVFFAGHAHPCKDKASATAYDIHFTFVFFDLFDGFSGNSTVKCDKVYTVFSVETDDINEIMSSQFREITLVVDHAVVHRNGSDHGRTFVCKFLTEWLCVAVTGKIHDCFCTEINGFHDFLHFDIVILAVPGDTEVYVDLCAEHAADTFRIQAGMVFVGTDRNFAFCDQFHQFLNRHMFFFCNGFDLRSYNPFAGSIHLCCVSCHIIFSPFM